VALLPGDGRGELAADAIALAPGHYTIVSGDESLLAVETERALMPPQEVACPENPPVLGLPMAYFDDR
jgi:hypothetical protein